MIPIDNHTGRHYRFPHWILDIPRRIQLWVVGNYRRARYGVAPQDTWSFDYYLSRVIANGLTQLAEANHRCTGGPNCGHGVFGFRPCTDEWLVEMRQAAADFERLADFDFVHDRATEAEAQLIKDRAFTYLAKNYHSLWD